jgi:tyrosyl-DNA phosphodiesterase-1
LNPDEAEQVLVAYFGHVGGFAVQQLRRFDFRRARGDLVASVPGTHKGSEMACWGHMRLRTLLRRVAAAAAADTQRGHAGAALARFDAVCCQFSSFGSLHQKWFDEDWLPSIGGGLGNPQLRLEFVIPTEEEVKRSLEGWHAGGAIPMAAKNHKPFYRRFDQRIGPPSDLYHHWAAATASDDGDVAAAAADGDSDGCAGRARAMPHIKSFTRYASGGSSSSSSDAEGGGGGGGGRGADVAWSLLTSHNMSSAAWGALQKNQSQLMIRSYELGVLITPETERRYWALPSNAPPVRLRHGSEPSPSQTCASAAAAAAAAATGEQQQRLTTAATTTWVPLPYNLPPMPYGSSDHPWTSDKDQHTPDSFGE